MSVAKPAEVKNRVRTILFAGGGTGGHLFPGIALAREFCRRQPDTQVVFAGTRRGLEARVIPALGYPLAFLEVHGLVGVSRRRRLQALGNFPKAVIQALILLVRYRPALVVGLGGYASAPVLLAAMIAGLPWVLQEQNAFPGLVNRVLAPWAAAVFIAFAKARKHLHSRKVYDYGNPLRFRRPLSVPEGITGGAPNDDDERDGFNLLVVGGSQGARVLNQVVPLALMQLWEHYPHLRVVHQSGAHDFAAVGKAYAGAGTKAEVIEFIDEIESCYKKADLLICRAGALTLAELGALGKPAILVPFPRAAHDHQTYNAEAFAQAGAAWVRKESAFTPESLVLDLEKLLNAPQLLKAMAVAASEQGRPDACEKIVAHCLQLMA
ncbi:MAG: undecaprenyldiphospho-muramoylpentapeptide beta-N-acetylglucosaminyltransferase [Deltaproteobacteria bacterium]|nr:undecaprenyldiphospho-muramoylpentapeptide beta-N-acetylglucosaminyltransferase [Deltaproteobacteria bacterium]